MFSHEFPRELTSNENIKSKMEKVSKYMKQKADRRAEKKAQERTADEREEKMGSENKENLCTRVC